MDTVLAGPAAAVLDLGYTLLVDDAASGMHPRGLAREDVDQWLAGLPPIDRSSDGDGDVTADGAPVPRSATPPPPDPNMRAEDVPGWGWDEVGIRRAMAVVGGSPEQMEQMPALGVPVSDVPLVDGATGKPVEDGET